MGKAITVRVVSCLSLLLCMTMFLLSRSQRHSIGDFQRQQREDFLRVLRRHISDEPAPSDRAEDTISIASSIASSTASSTANTDNTSMQSIPDVCYSRI